MKRMSAVSIKFACQTPGGSLVTSMNPLPITRNALCNRSADDTLAAK